MLTKQYQTRVKTLKDADGAPTGEVTAVVSAFGNVDLVGDRVVKGAFAKTLQDYKDSGSPIPMIWSHDWANPMSHIGTWDAAKAVETDEGLELTGQVFIGDGNPVADQAYKLMEKQLVREFSFAYDVISEQSAKDGANELLELALIEAGPTLKGANSATRLVAAKALKAGRTISAKNESALREALDAMSTASGSIKSVLSALDAPEEKNVTIADELEQEADDTSEVDALEPHALQPVMDALKAAVDGIGSYITAEVKDGEPEAEKDGDEPTDEPEPVTTPKSFDQDEVLRRLFVVEHG